MSEGGAIAEDRGSADTGADLSSLAVHASDLVKDFGFRRVLDGVSLEVPRGTFLTLFGPNGAGKTTLIRILTTISRPTSGIVRIAGLTATGPGKTKIRAKIGLISHQPLLYDHLTGMENILFFARLHGLEHPRRRAEELVKQFELWPRRDDRVGTYSRGMQQRLALARALVHDPELLLFDEPFTGLDPAASRGLLGLLQDLKHAGRSAVLTTHDLPEGLALGDRWGILVGGRLVAEGESRAITAAALTERYFEATGTGSSKPPCFS